ncbi:Hsp20/alpha crystallin family protein [Thiocystis violascens]|uniref:Molecular chaperone (Small heat shock protein) n=1 Tax=Thiocystis violascens (strain ATCC 17096 / DSM 198 / 6111) TaxID=765911 RepID=I3YF57_THIV6|nr:Hsp20/alpha crystallin family protein [Thiocystis violascens]AFL75625.1 molecular chaperone (small heat shock protein) [Thiocystis violascens DSM 198]
MRKFSLTTVALTAILPALTFAWTPYPGYPLPDGRPLGAPFGPMAPGDPGAWPVMPPSSPFGALAPMDSESRQMPPASRMRISRQSTNDAYLIDIALENIDSEQVEIRPAGRGLTISYSTRMQTSEEETLPRGEGFRRSYRVARGAASRRIALPPDADLANLSREISDNRIRLRIPRAAGGRWPLPVR